VLFRSLELYQQGLKPADIAEQRNLRVTTIGSHLAELLEMGYPVALEPLVSAERQASIIKALETVGDDSLTVLREFLGEVYGYDEIKLVRAQWRRENQVS